jgi:phosphate uptake regulator
MAETSVKLRSSDDRDFEVEAKIANMSLTIKNMLEGMWSQFGNLEELPTLESL